MISTTEMAAATLLPEPFFELCVDAGYLQPDKHARDAAAFTAFWASLKGRKRLTRPETIREMTMKVLAEAGIDDARENKTFARDMVAALSGEGPFADRPPEPDVEPLSSSSFSPDDIRRAGDNVDVEDEKSSEPETTSVNTIDGGVSEANDTDSIAVDDGKEVEPDD